MYVIRFVDGDAKGCSFWHAETEELAIAKWRRFHPDAQLVSIQRA
jgi:hypothetical protein